MITLPGHIGHKKDAAVTGRRLYFRFLVLGFSVIESMLMTFWPYV